MKKRVRIKDIADKAEVSTGTVDRVLHNRGNVASDVKQRVLEVIEELGYERNIIASALAYNKETHLATLLPETHIDPYWLQTNQGVLSAYKTLRHYGLILEQTFFDYGNPASFLQTAEQVLSTKPDGILFPPMFAQEAKWLIDECDSQQIPYVIINTNLESASPLCYIGQDSYQSGVLGARLLNFGLSEGGQVCILNLDYSTKAAQHLISKEQGFRDYFQDIKPKNVEIIRKDFERFDQQDELRTFLLGLLDEYPKLMGIFVTNSRAYKILDCLESSILNRKIKIVGFDLVAPNLKYLYEDKINFLINQNPSEQGHKGLHSLFKHLVHKEKIEKYQYLPLDIVVKENAKYHVQKISSREVIA